MVSQAQQRHLDKVTRMIPGYDAWATAGDCIFDYDAAQRACDFFPECLVHVKGKWAGRPIILEDWQQGIIANLFGWKRPDGTRRYRTCLIYIPRKNAKTTLAAGIGLYLLFLDGEHSAEIYGAAADEKQAAICFDIAKKMVVGCPALARRAKIFKEAITFEETGSQYHVLTSKAVTKHGLNPSGIIIDELHAQKDRELVDTLITGTGAREQPLTLELTTADFARPSLCNETYKYATDICGGSIKDPAFLPVIYEATREDDWTSEKTWEKANPNLGVSVNIEYIRSACKKAQDSPTYENTFKRLHLNIITEQADRWLQLDKWDRCAGELDYHQLAESLIGEECFAGLDLSSKLDLTALVLAFPPTEEREKWAVLSWCWAPKEKAIERERRDRAPYLTWEKDGLIALTPGNIIDLRFIRKRLRELKEVYHIKQVAFDKWGAESLAQELQDDDGFDMVDFRQGPKSFCPPTKTLEKMIIGAELVHGANPLLRWCASNVSIIRDSNDNIRPCKTKSLEKIDPIVAMIMAIGIATAGDVAGESIYENGGLAFAGIGSETTEPQEDA